MKMEGNYYCIFQPKYIEKILNNVGLQDAKNSKIPLDPGYMKSRNAEILMEESEKYQMLMGALLYVAVNT